MSITTFLTTHEAEAQSDADLQPLLDSLRDKTGQRWVVLRVRERRTALMYGIFRVPRVLYSLYAQLDGHEYQLINFYQDDTGTSINTWVTKAMVVAYLRGYLSGLQDSFEEKL